MVGSSVGHTNTPPQGKELTWRQVAAFAVAALIMPAALFAAAGHLDWPAAWAYTAVTMAAVVGSRLIVALKHPDLLAERGRFAQLPDAKAWDRKLMPIVGLAGPLATLVVAGLDERFGWSPDLSISTQVGGLIAVALGSLLSVWAMAVNRFYSAVVRIQTDRGHSVVSTGPYRFVRHPSYTGGIVAYVGACLLLDSLWALVPTTILAVVLVARTALEDRTLREELAGYEKYASRVRYRLLPGIW